MPALSPPARFSRAGALRSGACPRPRYARARAMARRGLPTTRSRAIARSYAKHNPQLATLAGESGRARWSRDLLATLAERVNNSRPCLMATPSTHSTIHQPRPPPPWGEESPRVPSPLKKRSRSLVTRSARYARRTRNQLAPVFIGWRTDSPLCRNSEFRLRSVGSWGLIRNSPWLIVCLLQGARAPFWIVH